MSAHTKKPPTEQIVLTIQAGEQLYFVGPKSKLQALLSVVRGFNFKPVAADKRKSIPWKETLKVDINKYSEAGFTLSGARLKAGLTQQELAKQLGVAQYNISKMETGKRPIGKKMAQRLAQVLKTDYRVFL